MAGMLPPEDANVAGSGARGGELVEQVRRRARRGAEVVEVEALVLAVRVAGRVLEAEEQRRDPAHHLGERTDEGDRSAAADLDGLAPEARPERAVRRREGGARRAR